VRLGKLLPLSHFSLTLRGQEDPRRQEFDPRIHEAEFCTEGSGLSGSSASRPVFKIFTIDEQKVSRGASKKT